MKRQRIKQQQDYDDYRYVQDDSDSLDRTIPLQTQRVRKENLLEAQIQEGDTLQAIALRYNCTISDIKRLNKIEKEIEIHARKTIKVPVNAHSILLNTHEDQPTVHTSGQSSPKIITNNNDTSHNSLLPNYKSQLDEKLLVASVTLATSIAGPSTAPSNSINDIILNSAITRKEYSDESAVDAAGIILNADDDDDLAKRPLLLCEVDDGSRSAPHAIRGAPRTDLSCSGSDCDISWICLLVFILALCFAIPLVYIFYIAEHPEKFHH